MELVKNTFPPLRSSNYRRYFIANIISFIGTWLHRIALGYLIYDLTKSALWVGFIGALSFSPSLLFSLYAGALVDRVNKRIFIIITQTFQGVVVGVFALLVSMGYINPWLIVVVTFLLGVADAFDLPARQSYVVHMVGKEVLPSAIALNATSFNAARVIGPASAGIVLATIGMTGIFFINAMSYFVVVYAIYSMKIKETIHDNHPHPITAIKNGLIYVMTHTMIRPMLFLTAVCSIFGWPYMTLMPVYSKEILHQGIAGLGLLQSAAGLGAVIGSFITSAYSHKFGTERFVFLGMILAGFFLTILSFIKSMLFALILLFFVGLSFVMTFSMLNATVQRYAKDEFRGRVMSVYSMMLIGVGAIGNLLTGYISEWYSVTITFLVCGMLLFLISLITFIKQKHKFI